MIEMPLQYFGCAIGASITADSTTISFPGNDHGIAIYGPYVKLRAGYYKFRLLLNIPMTAMMPRLKVEIYAGSTVYAEREITTHCERFYIIAYFDHEVAVEIRIFSNWTKFDLNGVSYEPIEGAVRSSEKSRSSIHKSLISLLKSQTDQISSNWNTVESAKDAIFGDSSVFAFLVEDLHRHTVMLQRLGIDAAAVRALFNQPETAAKNATQSGFPIDQNSDDVRALSDGHPQVSNSFQEKAILNGGLEIISPFSGEVVKSVDSIPVPLFDTIAPVMYEFIEHNPFVVGASCGWVGSLSFIWFIEQDIIIVSNPGEAMWANPEQAIAFYISFSVNNVELLRSYRGKNRTVALSAGFIGNMGHYFWNEVAGIERMIRATDLLNVTKIYCRKTNWIQIADIFDETIESRASLTAEVLPSINDLPFSVLRNNEFLVRPTATSIDAKLAEKIQRKSVELFKSSQPQRYEKACTLLSNSGFVLFSNLRAHNKCWKEQREGIIAIANVVDDYFKQPRSRLAADGDWKDAGACKGPVVIFLDGFHDCADEAQAIMKNAPGSVIFVDGTKVTFAETLFWAFNCNAFTAVVGSGLVPVTWLADKSGVCYSERQHLRQMAWWRSVRKLSGTILHPQFDDITDDVDQLYANFSISPKVISDLMRLVLIKQDADRLNS
ncbi:hypothetical protein SAMN05216360_10625 [Methylobacterium phyllostachyos]|uniref:Uncharacterized protein n=1 Tax=Methylobacterium phyllostachyos TaxID=582672 RepID=A0A1G9YYQ3_9HYPH|nr:hypothetical protein [Methylobacterium phyllostachyos]SDN14194.1 hypothetical protein SAMN05216360_10625 [Methylobacterium phyllostachyos]